jgi:endonuclease/exonuclease/phosphatase family metal-dependent hydrolase
MAIDRIAIGRMSIAFVFALTLSFFSQTTFASGFVWDESDRQNGDQIRQVRRVSNQGLSVFWWNIHNGITNQEIQKTSGRRPLDQNLKRLIKSDFAPDVFAFGEFSPRAICSQTLQLLFVDYPHVVFFPYNHQNREFGILVASRWPIVSSFSEPLMSHETFESNERTRRYENLISFSRPFIELEIRYQEKSYHLYPAHLFHSWREVSERRGKIGAAREVFWGLEHIVAVQVVLLKAWMNEAPRERRILVGDFNIPRNLPLLTDQWTAAYSELARGLKELNTGRAPTFPARSQVSEEYGFSPLKIDHAFVSPEVENLASFVLRLQGSDHYPLYFTVK